jgi:negative regulator of sigma-B (phosphoserine phosphatase)
VCDEASWPAVLERGEAGAPLAGESRSGDLAVWATYDGGALVAAIDGLGHGGAAADAAEVAAAQLRAHAAQPPETALKRCHEALRATRGVVATVAWFDLDTCELTWTGIGNVEGRLVRADRRPGDSPDSPMLFGGVLGWSLPAVRPVRTTLAPGDCLVMATDGVAADFNASLQPGLPAPEQARLTRARVG